MSKSESTPQGDRIFRSLMDVLRYLQDKDYQIEKSKLYQDKNERLIRVDKRQPIPESEVLAYIMRSGLQKKSEVRPEEVDRSTQEKRALDIEGQKIKNKKDQFAFEKEQKLWIRRGDAERRQAEMLMIIDTTYRRLVDTMMYEICGLLAGNTKNMNDAKDYAEAEWETVMNKLARTDSFQFIAEDE